MNFDQIIDAMEFLDRFARRGNACMRHDFRAYMWDGEIGDFVYIGDGAFHRKEPNV